MKRAAIFLLAAITTQCSRESRNKFFEHWAHFAISTKTAGLTHYYTVLRVLSGNLVGVAGIHYDILFEVAPSNCAIADGPYSSEVCKPITNKPCAVCETSIWYIPWRELKFVTFFECHKIKDKHR
ncbi:hypothetical protein MRX96_040593 [Rhipicephalus microplus]